MIKIPNFITTKLEEERDNNKETFTIWLNKDERALLDKYKKILEQPKDSTALKTLAWLGAKLLDEPKIAYILETIFINKRRNKRTGIVEIE